MLDVVLDSLLDTAKLLPFLLLIYIVIELIEHNTSLTDTKLTGKMAPLLGAATGLIPQCGFSVMAAKLYDRGFLRTGTILAIFLATSDEAFILLLTSGSGAVMLLPLILVKLIVAVGVGYLVNFLLRKETLAGEPEEENCNSCGREHSHNPWKTYLFAPLLHTLQVAFYILLVNLIFGFFFYFVGEDNVLAFLSQGIWIQPIITSLIGLIPNCASSVIITNAYLLQGITFGSMAAGLCANAGLGFVVLLKNTKKWKRNILLVLTIYVISLVVGYAVNGISFLLPA